MCYKCKINKEKAALGHTLITATVTFLISEGMFEKEHAQSIIESLLDAADKLPNNIIPEKEIINSYHEDAQEYIKGVLEIINQKHLP